MTGERSRLSSDDGDDDNDEFAHYLRKPTCTSLNMGRGKQINMTSICVVHAKIKIVPSVFIHILHSQKTKAINNTTQVW